MILTGRVQGIGLRPAIARYAKHLSLTGFVSNTHDGVEIHVEGRAGDVESFERGFRSRLPATNVISSFQRERVPLREDDGFTIGPSAPLSERDVDASPTLARLSARVPPDVVVCDACLAEVKDSADRRHGYPFSSCTECGPRYTIIERMPYERGQTSMSAFTMCECCLDEYRAPDHRRFHAQTNACPNCGPETWLRDGRDRVIARRHEVVPAAAASLRDGRILALRGLGGYQLLADATSREAVERLRQRKRRRGKPLAVMVRSLEEADTMARLDDTERRLLQSPAGPIVVADARPGSPIASEVTAGLNTIGLMLPTTPLHGLILDSARRPLVCTSGNVEGDPLVYRSEAALGELGGVADVWLEHDRPIRRPLDDSVVRVIAGRPVSMRSARGYAPLPLDLEPCEPVVAPGGHQKTAIAIANGAQAVLGPHIGDLDTVSTRQRHLQERADLSALYGVEEGVIGLSDQHPDYITTQWADSRYQRVERVQHHHAHIAAGMLEHGWLDRTVLGVAFDGTGYGSDGTIWGGEFLLATATGFERVGHLRPLALPGGERAVREPWRVAAALVCEAAGEEAAARLVFRTGDVTSLLPVFGKPRFSPSTTSAGRLFDGVAALVLGIERCRFEGQAAMLLEAAARQVGDRPLPMDGIDDSGTLPGTMSKGGTAQIDWRPLVREILLEQAAGAAPGGLAMRFHDWLANAIVDFCRRYAPLPVVLGGGVFQNGLLVERLARRFAGTGQPLGLPGWIPPNDGGLAAGQLAVGTALIRQGRNGACV